MNLEIYYPSSRMSVDTFDETLNKEDVVDSVKTESKVNPENLYCLKGGSSVLYFQSGIMLDSTSVEAWFSERYT